MRTQDIFARTARVYQAGAKLAAALQSPFLLLIRFYWGWQFAQTGWGKLHHLSTVTSFFTTLGIPAAAFSAEGVAWLELLGGVGLALGLGSRFWALLLASDMFVAYLTAGRDNLLKIISDPGKFYADDAYTFLFASLLILIFGPGKLSADALFLALAKPRATRLQLERS